MNTIYINPSRSTLGCFLPNTKIDYPPWQNVHNTAFRIVLYDEATVKDALVGRTPELTISLK